MKPDLILHIGTTKTGSTSIQYVLDSKAAELPAQGVYWPETHGAKRHLLLALACSSNKRPSQMLGNPVWQGMQPSKRLAAYQAEFDSEIKNLPDTTRLVVISAEQFSELLRDEAEIRHLREILAPLFSNITVVIYLRRQDSHYASMYAQMLRMGNLHEPNLVDVKVGFNHDYDYMDLLTRWSNVFGEAAVQPRLFGSSGKVRFDVVDDFLSLCGVELTLSKDDQKRSRNPSMNLVGQRTLLQTGAILDRREGEIASKSAVWNKIASAVTQVSSGNGWLPTREEAQSSIDRFAETNEAVRQKWFSDRASLFDNNLDKLPQAHGEHDLAAGFDTACAALLEIAQSSLRREQALQMQIAKYAAAAGADVAQANALRHAIALDSHDVSARVQLAQLHIKSGNINQAKAVLNVTQELEPNNPAVRKLAEQLGVEHPSGAPASAVRRAGGKGKRPLRA